MMTLEVKKALIKKAVDEKRPLKIKYHNALERIINPYHCGEHGKDRAPSLFAWQTGGFSSTNIQGWKNFDLIGIVHIELTDDVFEISPDYDARHPRYQNLICQIK
jgi:hypothetical protein